jgi:Domain of unknown function (DUF1707)/Cell wall-active antibiotics response 4TMS YvqF
VAGDELIRASDAERERAIDVLREAAGHGRLTFEELADRIGAAGAAPTRGELGALIADLPVDSEVLSGREIVVPTKTSVVFADVRRSGQWRVPPSSRWESLFGDIVLDLREAQVGGGEVAIDAGTIFGDVDILVPEGVAVEVRSRTLFGDIRQDAGGVAPAGAPRIVLTGGTVFGDVRVRSSRFRERLGQRWRGRGQTPT